MNYPISEPTVLWLPDASVKFLNGRHIILFIATLLILLAGAFYTILVFSWQWLLRLPQWKIFNWVGNPRIQTFIETYHIPYTAKYRYWTGLLLLTRAILYLVSAMNVSNDPQVVLTSITITVGVLLFLKGRLYKKWALDMLETFFYFNLLLVSAVTWYSLGHSDSNWTKVVSYTAISISFTLLTIIVVYHAYVHTSFSTMLHCTNFGKFIINIVSKNDPEPRTILPTPLFDDDVDRARYHEMVDIIDSPVNTSDYEQLQGEKPVVPSRSVVEVHKPLQQPYKTKE